MDEGEKKGFWGSKAFWLILLWLGLGVVLSVVIYSAKPAMIRACQAWDEAVPDPEEVSELMHEAGHEGGHGEINYCQEAEHKSIVKPGELFEVSAHPNLTAAFLSITKMPLGTAWAIPNFLVLVTLLWHFGRDPLQQQLKTRREELKKAIAEAKAARAEAEAKKQEYEKLLAEIGLEIEKLRGEMHQEGEAEKARLIAEAARQAERIKNEAEFTARQELRMAEYRLREVAARLAVEVAEKVIRETITGEDRERLLNEYLQKVREARL